MVYKHTKYKVAITGGSGLVGSRIIELLSSTYDFIPLSHDTVDITNKGQVEIALRSLSCDFLIHLAAYTNVDMAEHEPEKAHQLNVNATKNLFEISRKKNIKFIYFSTDFVFDGQHPPFFETSKPSPINVYGETKYKGEQIVKNNALILRISFPYRKEFDKKRDFLRNIVLKLQHNEPAQLITDALMTPTYVDDIAYALNYLLQNYSHEVIHIVGSESLTPYDIGTLIAKKYSINPSLLIPVSYTDYFAEKVLRPQYAEIKSIKNNFYTMKPFNEGLLLM